MKRILKPFIVLALLCGQNILAMEPKPSECDILLRKREASQKHLTPTTNDHEAGAPADTVSQKTEITAPSVAIESAAAQPSVTPFTTPVARTIPLLPCEHELDPMSLKTANKRVESSPWELQSFIFELTNNEASAASQAKEIMLFGPAGSGKSTLGVAIAITLGRIPHFIKMPKLLDKFQSSGSEHLAEALHYFDTLKQPCVVILDEMGPFIDKYKCKDHDPGIIEGLWTEIDSYASNPNFIFIYTTNELNDCPAPFKSRIKSNMFFIPKAEPEERKKIIEDCLSFTSEQILKNNTPCFDPSITPKYLSALAKKTTNFSNRDLTLLVRNARNFAHFREKLRGNPNPFNSLPAQEDLERAFLFAQKNDTMAHEYTPPTPPAPDTRTQAFFKHPMSIAVVSTIASATTQFFLQRHALGVQQVMQNQGITAQQTMQNTAINSNWEQGLTIAAIGGTIALVVAAPYVVIGAAVGGVVGAAGYGAKALYHRFFG